MMTRVVRVTVFGTWLTTIVLLASTATAGTIYVDDDAPSDPGHGDPTVSDPAENGTAAHPFDAIQEAIDAAGAGDIVELADGTYAGAGNRDLDFAGKAFTVRSASGDAAVCTINCEGAGRGLVFDDAEGPDSKIEGLTITGGHGYGGGVYCGGASPTLINCVIRGNVADYNGGGIVCADGGHPTLTECTISDNRADGGGAGVYCYLSSNPTLLACTITGNTGYSGVGVACYESGPTLTGCVISANRASNSGAGISCREDSNLTLIGCTIVDNVADNDGGGIRCTNSSPLILRCRIEANTAAGTWQAGIGGGVCCEDGSKPTIVNCTICNNTIASRTEAGEGGGIGCHDSGPTLINCTISGNTADVGGGLYCVDGVPTLTNCILWGDVPQEIHAPSGVDMAYCDIQGIHANGIIDADPRFIDADGADNDPNTWEDNDFRLSAGSPTIDAGDNAAVPTDTQDLDGDGDTTEATPVDLGGNARFFDDASAPDTGAGGPPLVDMGAYEYAPGASGGPTPGSDGAPGIVPAATPAIGACPLASSLALTLALVGLGRSYRQRAGVQCRSA